MSGRGLGHTGGTIDKLESISGMKVELPEEEFVSIVRSVGCAVVGQSPQLAPADKRLYALRDVTATVDSIPLIVSSILSKKFAAGAKAIVLDVKAGSGAIMPTLEASIELAKAMVDIGSHAGRKIIAVVSGMEEPLGSHVGNALEVKEAIDILSGRAAGPLKQVSLFLGSQMLVASGVTDTEEKALAMLNHALDSGAGLNKLKEMITAQGGDCRVCDDVSRLPQAPVLYPVKARQDGYLSHVNGTALGLAAQRMGAGRISKADIIDPAVGFVMEKRIGDRSGKIYGLGHAIYTISDPRAMAIKRYAKALVAGKGLERDFAIADAVERIGIPMIMERTGRELPMCANVDLYSGLVYKALGIPEDLFTPLFAIARIAGWCAHRLEELVSGGKIIRPAYRSSMRETHYVPMSERTAQ